MGPEPESAAWIYSRMALYQLQSGDLGKSFQYCQATLAFQTDYPPALLVRGRLFLAEGRKTEAVESLNRAVTLNPLPKYQWALAEALRAVGRADSAAAALEARRR